MWMICSLLASKSMEKIQSLKAKLNSEFDIKDLGDTKRILGMDILRDKPSGNLFLTLKNYLFEGVKKV